jgi:uridine kinase
MYKNILIIGAARTGKTTLSRRIDKEFGHSIINLDDIISSLKEAFPELGIKHDYDDMKISARFAPFLINYLKELSEGPNFYNNAKYVIEGVQFDFEKNNASY